MWKPLLLLLVCAALFGCGGAPACTPTGFSFNITPGNNANLAPDHSQKAPGNQEKFQATASPVYGPHCVVPAFLAVVNAQWTVADSKDVSISSADDSTNGLATCTGATNGAVTLTATYTMSGFTETATDTITCK